VSIGIPELLVLLPLFFLFVPFFLLPWAVLRMRRHARARGYTSLRAYLRAAPVSDDQRRDAAKLTMAGVVCCFLGVLFAPLVLVGVVPLYYGGRKLIDASLGLGLIDDADEPRA
jgi:hypothetical protein